MANKPNITQDLTQFRIDLLNRIDALPVDRKQLGQYAPNALPFAPTTVVALTASRAYVVRFVAEKDQTITRMAFVLTTAAGANDNCDVGIFDSTLTSLLGSSGSTAGKLNVGSPPTLQTLNLTAGVPLVQGTVYYAAFAVGTFGGTAAQVAVTSLAGASTLSAMFGSTAGLIEQSFQASAFPLAAPFTVGGAIANCPALALLQ